MGRSVGDQEFHDGRARLLAGDCLERLKELPDCSVDSVVTDLAAGTAAEHLVCADLLLSGFRAFLADQNCPFDVAVDIGGGRIVRLQVKATRSQRSVPNRDASAYMWHVRRAGKGGKRLYGSTDFDLLALVGLDIRRIAYLPPSLLKQMIHIRPPWASGGKHFANYPFAKALAEIVTP